MIYPLPLTPARLSRVIITVLIVCAWHCWNAFMSYLIYTCYQPWEVGFKTPSFTSNVSRDN